MKIVRVGHSLKNLDLMEGILQILKQCFRCTKKGIGFLSIVACVASVSVWFRSKERPRSGIFGFDRAKNGLCAVLVSRSSFSAPKPHGNACFNYRSMGL